MSELSALVGSEGYEACVDDAPFAQLVRRPQAVCRCQPAKPALGHRQSNFATGRGRLLPERRNPSIAHAPLAQLVEQLTLNQWVPGSSP